MFPQSWVQLAPPSGTIVNAPQALRQWATLHYQRQRRYLCRRKTPSSAVERDTKRISLAQDRRKADEGCGCYQTKNRMAIETNPRSDRATSSTSDSRVTLDAHRSLCTAIELRCRWVEEVRVGRAEHKDVSIGQHQLLIIAVVIDDVVSPLLEINICVDDPLEPRILAVPVDSHTPADKRLVWFDNARTGHEPLEVVHRFLGSGHDRWILFLRLGLLPPEQKKKSMQRANVTATRRDFGLHHDCAEK